jgi:hypothetical protein
VSEQDTRISRAKAKRAWGRALPALELSGRWSVPRCMPLPLVKTCLA